VFENWIYLLLLLGALCSLSLIDYRYRLALFYKPKRTALVLGVAVLLFLLWDIAGVQLGIFFIGQTNYLTGLSIFPEVPIEEVFFLLLLNYNALLIWRGGARLWPRI
jgi:lycopene cyclase domain-containing protein